MNAKEKTYAMALAALLLVGLSTAWAGYNDTSSISITTSSADFATVNCNQASISLSDLKKNVWFYRNIGTVFTISNIQVSAIYVTVGVIGMADLADDFKALDFDITLKYAGGVDPIARGVISLEGGVSTVLLTAEDISSGSTLKVDVSVGGRPAKTDSSVVIQMYCAVEPAVVVTP